MSDGCVVWGNPFCERVEDLRAYYEKLRKETAEGLGLTAEQMATANMASLNIELDALRRHMAALNGGVG